MVTHSPHLPAAHNGRMGAKRDTNGTQRGTPMPTVASQDGTTIAYDASGQGPAVVVVDGATGYRGAFGGDSELALQLAPHFTVYRYDRRGRGESGDTQPFAVAREVEDIEALIDAAVGAANLYGMSSGGALALEAALGLLNKV